MLRLEDYLRVGIIAMSGVVVALSITVVVAYYMRWKRTESKSERLLPAHVWGIALSHLMYVIFGVVILFSRVGKELTWVAPAYATAASLGMWAMIMLTQHEMNMLWNKKKQNKREVDEKEGRGPSAL